MASGLRSAELPNKRRSKNTLACSLARDSTHQAWGQGRGSPLSILPKSAIHHLINEIGKSKLSSYHTSVPASETQIAQLPPALIMHDIKSHHSPFSAPHSSQLPTSRIWGHPFNEVILLGSKESPSSSSSRRLRQATPHHLDAAAAVILDKNICTTS